MDIKGQRGEVRMEVTITRKDTGKTETHTLIGTIGADDGDDTLNSCKECGNGCCNCPDRDQR